ncbi:MAG: hypothetical protein AAF658_15385, partial [Myxococcota bacterium]
RELWRGAPPRTTRRKTMGLTYGLIALAAVFGAFTLALFGRVRALSTESAGLRSDYEKARAEIRELAEKERKASQRLDERVNEVQALKKELGGHKKKSFASAEELKALRAELKEAKDSAKRVASSKPAFADEPTPKVEGKSSDAPEKKSDPVPGLQAEIDVLKEKIASLESETQGLRKKGDSAEGDLRKAKAELRKAKRRVDEYRRADQVTRSRNELADDKIRHLGRQYYEVVSELAALKGEVAPPPPRELEEVRREAAEVERAPVRAVVGDADTGGSNAAALEDASAGNEPSDEKRAEEATPA